MPLYSSDVETLNIVRYAISVFKYRDYLSGFSELSAYLASLSFEKIIIQTGKKFRLHEGFKIDKSIQITAVLDFLRKKRLINETEYRRLRACRDFRHKIMHEGVSKGDVQQTRCILEKVCEMVGIVFEKELEQKEFEDSARSREPYPSSAKR